MFEFSIWIDCLVAMVEVAYPFPFRTRKSSPLTPMILPPEGWESRSLPGFFINYSFVRILIFELVEIIKKCYNDLGIMEKE